MKSSYKENNFYDIFCEITKNISPKLIVEFGILEGYSLQSFIDSREKGCQIDAYDLFDEFPYNAANYNLINEKFGKFENIKIEKLDFFKGFEKYENSSINILHVDIANNGDVFKFAIKNYFSKIKKGGCMILEGGSVERDNVEWMIKYNKKPIYPYLQLIKDKYKIQILSKFPSITIIKK